MAAMRRRHELRAVLKNYDRPRRLLVVVDLAAGSIVEAVLALLRGDRARAKRVGDAWWWNWRHRRSRKTARKALARVRQQPDSVVALMLSRGGRRSALEAGQSGEAVLSAPAPSPDSIRPVGPAVETLFGNEDDAEPVRAVTRRRAQIGPSRTGLGDGGLGRRGAVRRPQPSRRPSAPRRPALAISGTVGPAARVLRGLAGRRLAGNRAGPSRLRPGGPRRSGPARQHRAGGEAAVVGPGPRRRGRDAPAPAPARVEPRPAGGHDRLSRTSARLERHRRGRPAGSRELCRRCRS